MRVALKGARLATPDGALRPGTLVVEGGVIAEVGDGQAPAGAEVIRLDGGILAPGFVDVQVNGGGGILLNETPTPEGVLAIADAHARFGTTGLLPTVITDRPEVTWAAVDAVRRAREAGAKHVLGIHIEGPFLDPKRRGAHPPECIRAIGEDDISRLASAAHGPESCGAVLLTVSPAHVPPAVIERLVAAGVTISLGHSDATADQVLAALAAGASGFTHLFNAMSQLAHRAPGMVGAALASPEAYCGFIADGFHVDPLALRVALAAKPVDRMVMVSDAMPPAAGGPDRFELQGREVLRRDGRLELADGTLAGSNLTMAEALRYTVERLGVALPAALAMATANPAGWIGLGGQMGRLAPGLAASLVHLGDDLAVRAAWIAGRPVSLIA
jgi:N-acetylglucosamine-6-phosphate deacetylase